MPTERIVLDVAPGALSDYYDWLKSAKAGDTLVYWMGDLQYDRQVVIPDGDIWREQERLRLSTLNVVASRVYEDAQEGNLHLTQRRLGTNVFEYRATRRRPEYITRSEEPQNGELVLA